MQTYNITEIKQLAKEEDYKYAALVNQSDEKIINWNTPKSPISGKIAEIEKKLKSRVLPDGLYFVCLSQKIGKGQHIDKLPIVKGNVNTKQEGTTVIIKDQPVLSEKGESVLSYEAALEYQNEISRLTYENKFLQDQNEKLAERIAELEAELEETEQKEPITGLSEHSGVGSWVKSLAETALPALDRYFDLEEKKLQLAEKKIQAQNQPQARQIAKPVQIKIGSKEHLQIIEDLYNAEKEEELNKQLDLLQANQPEIYAKVMEHLNLETEEETEEN